MKTKKRLMLSQHEAISAILKDPLIVYMSCDIQNAYGSTSRAARLVRKYANAAMHLRSEMENMCFKDGYSGQAQNLYYPWVGECKHVPTNSP